MSNEPVYTMEGGQIFRKGDLVGCYDQKTGDILELSAELPPQIPAMLRRMISEEVKPPGVPLGKTLVEVFAAEKSQPHATEIPPEPPQGPEGDKTPAWAYWLRVYHPERFAKQFAGRKVMGVQVPPQSSQPLPDIPAPPASQPPGDIPESSMAKEAEEVWFRK